MLESRRIHVFLEKNINQKGLRKTANLKNLMNLSALSISQEAIFSASNMIENWISTLLLHSLDTSQKDAAAMWVMMLPAMKRKSI